MQRTLLFASACGRSATIRASAPAGTAVGPFVQACAAAVGARLDGDIAIWHTTPAGRVAPLDPAATIEDADVRSGDRVDLRPASSSHAGLGRRRCRIGGLELVAVGGPRSGERWPLGQGINPITRASDGALVGGCEEGSDRRDDVMAVDVDGDRVRVVPGALRHGIRIDGQPVPGHGTVWAPGAWAQVGADVLVVRAVAGGGPERRRAASVRPPRVGAPAPPAPLHVPAAPVRSQRGSIPVGVVIAPVVVAIVAALVLGNPAYLLFGAVSPLMGMWRLVGDARGGRRAFRRDQRHHELDLHRARDEISSEHAAVLRARRAAMPDAAALVDRAVADRSTVWERRPGDADFLVMRVGVGDVDTMLDLRWPDAAGAGDTPAVEASLIAEHARDRCVPVTVGLDGGALGVAGPDHERRGVARMIALQVAVLHDPSEVVLVIAAPAAVAPGRWGEGWEWALLAPHTTVPADLAEAVTAHAAAFRDAATRRRMVVVVDTDLDAATRTALSEAVGAGVSVVWCTDTRDRLPRACTHVLVVESSTRSRLTEATGDATAAVDLVADHARTTDCRTGVGAVAARADEAGHAPRDLPRVVGFHETLSAAGGLDARDPEAVAAAWGRGRSPMRCLIGRGGGGPVFADLDADGPHALVVGTTGSGKSELFTTMLASLAVTVPPSRLAFLLVDFKGGAAFDRLAALPHTAGVVTDLDGALAERVLVALEAETRRRMETLRVHGAPDVGAWERERPDAAPPRLVVVVDEFAALSREVPGFVDGLVDLARRGRSLGVHLLVGTQQPDANTAKLAGNTNLRVCLRVQDPAVSREVTGVPDAGRFPRDLRGRAVVARGHGDTIEVQTAWAGRAAMDVSLPRVEVLGMHTATGPPAEAGGVRSEIDEVVEAVAGAWARSGGPPQPHSVWVPPPPPVVRLDDLEPGTARAPVVGIADEAHLQRLSPMRFDLESWGSVLVTGRSGSGRTTLLRTVAAAAAGAGGTRGVAVYGLDFGDGALADLAGMPQCADVVAGSEIERVDRLFAVLTGEAALRVDDPARRRPAIVVLVDGIGAFAAAHADWTDGHLATLRRLCEDGRALGIHVVAAGDPASVPARLRDACGAGVELRMPGEAAGPDGVRWRVAIAGERCGRPGEARTSLPRIDALPAEVSRSDLGPGEPGAPVLGVAADTMGPVTCDLGRVPLFLAAGPMRSGRSTALATLTRSIAELDPDTRMVLLAPRRGPLVDLGCWSEVAVGPEGCTTAAAALAGEVRGLEGAAGGGTGPGRVVAVVDDAEILSDGTAAIALDEVARRCWDAGVWLLAAAESHAAARSFGWLMQLRVCRHGIVLRADPDLDSEVFRVRLPRRRGYRSPTGRAELVGGDSIRLVQVAR